MAGGAPGPGRGKNGRGAAAGGVVIETVQKLAGEEAAKAQKEAEVGAGLRCGGCGERVSSGFEFVVIETGRYEGRVFGNFRNMVACPGLGDCTFAAEAAKHAVAMRSVKQRFLDTPEMQEKIGYVLERAEGAEHDDDGT